MSYGFAFAFLLGFNDSQMVLFGIFWNLFLFLGFYDKSQGLSLVLRNKLSLNIFLKLKSVNRQINSLLDFNCSAVILPRIIIIIRNVDHFHTTKFDSF